MALVVRSLAVLFCVLALVSVDTSGVHSAASTTKRTSTTAKPSTSTTRSTPTTTRHTTTRYAPWSTTKSSTTRSTTRATTRRTTARTTAKHSANTAFYYLDNINTCTSTYTSNIKYLWHSSDVAYVKAWGTTYPHIPVGGSCHITISGYANDGLKYKFTGGSLSNYINSGQVTLEIYEGDDDYGVQLGYYDQYSTFPTKYITTTSNYITIVLTNSAAYTSTSYDFTIYIKSYDYYTDMSGGAIAGMVIGICVFLFIIFLIAGIAGRRRRRRLLAAGYARQVDPVVTSTTTTTYNYPTGAAPYPSSYGSMGSSPYAAAPQANYNGAPPPPNYNGAPPPPNYNSEAAPPPPSYGAAPSADGKSAI